MVRLLMLLLGMLTTGRAGRQEPAWHRCRVCGCRDIGRQPWTPTSSGRARVPSGRAAPPRCHPGRLSREMRAGHRARVGPGGIHDRGGGGSHGWSRGRRWSLVIGLIFRRAIASVVLMALSAALHLVGLNVHLPSIKFALAVADDHRGHHDTNTDLGPWVLQKIEGISKPALGQVSFNFYFTHKVSKNIGPWPCWYASTFYAVGHAAATVDLNPGPSWWKASAGHYQLQVLSRPAQGKPGHVAVSMVLPQAPAPAVGARRDDRQHSVAADRHPAQLDLSGARLRPGPAPAVRPGGALLAGPVHRLLQGDPSRTGHRAAGADRGEPGAADRSGTTSSSRPSMRSATCWTGSPCAGQA